MEVNVLKEFEPLFYPKRIAVIGASDNPNKVGYLIVSSLRSCGYDGAVYLVNPNISKSIYGWPIFSEIDSLPDGIDLYLFGIPHKKIIEGLIQAEKKKAKAAIIYASGFKETGEEGRKLEEEIKRIAKRSGMKIIGPNCIGILNLSYNLNATFVPGFSFLPKGDVAIVSQSGGVGMCIACELVDTRCGVGKVASIGNRASIEFSDMIEYLSDDPETKVITIFLEGTEDARRLFETLRKNSGKKPILAFCAGSSEKGSKLALSHTGSCATSFKVYEAALKQAQVLQLESADELADTAKVLLLSPPLRKNGIAIITHTAGPAIIATDICERGGLKIVEFSDEVKEKLKDVFPPLVIPQNPYDMASFGWIDKEKYAKVLDVVFSQDDVGAALLIYASSLDPSFEFCFDSLKEVYKRHKKPIIICLIAPEGYNKEAIFWEESGIPVFSSPKRAARALVNLYRYARLKRLVR